MAIENDRKLFDVRCSLSQSSCLRGFGSILVGLLLGGLLALSLVLGSRGGLGAPCKGDDAQTRKSTLKNGQNQNEYVVDNSCKYTVTYAT
jgi:hypothetical protein